MTFFVSQQLIQQHEKNVSEVPAQQPESPPVCSGSSLDHDVPTMSHHKSTSCNLTEVKSVKTSGNLLFIMISNLEVLSNRGENIHIYHKFIYLHILCNKWMITICTLNTIMCIFYRNFHKMVSIGVVLAFNGCPFCFILLLIELPALFILIPYLIYFSFYFVHTFVHYFAFQCAIILLAFMLLFLYI